MTRLWISQSDQMDATLMRPNYIKQKHNDNEIIGRTSLAGCVYKDTIYYFFGETGFQKLTQTRQMTNEVIQYKWESNELTKHKPWHDPDRLLAPRRNFCGARIGSDWVCFGGLTSGNRLTDQIIKVSLPSL
jgi:hypothetical protein